MSVGIPTVPAGVPPLTVDVLTVDPVKIGTLTDPRGVMVSEPPDVPAFCMALVVPTRVKPLNAAISE